MQLHFDEATHTYTLDGVVVIPSVTQVIAPIRPGFDRVPPAILEAKRSLGTAVHLACELDDADELDEETLPAALAPYLSAWRKFRADTGAVIIENETRHFHRSLMYAGTIDRLADIGNDTWLIDLKTSADPDPSYGVQLAGYEELLRSDGLHVEIRRATVHLRDDGTYRLHEFKNHGDHAAFRACLALHNWKASQ